MDRIVPWIPIVLRMNIGRPDTNQMFKSCFTSSSLTFPFLIGSGLASWKHQQVHSSCIHLHFLIASICRIQIYIGPVDQCSFNDHSSSSNNSTVKTTGRAKLVPKIPRTRDQCYSTSTVNFTQQCAPFFHFLFSVTQFFCSLSFCTSFAFVAFSGKIFVPGSRA